METRCKQGKLVISDRSVQVIKARGPLLGDVVLWSVQRQAIIGVTADNKVMGSTIVFNTAAGSFSAEMVTKAKAQEIIQMFS